MENQSFLKKFVSNIVSSIKAAVNTFAFNHLKNSGSFNPDEAYYTMNEYGGTLGEYANNKFFGQLFSRKASL